MLVFQQTEVSKIQNVSLALFLCKKKSLHRNKKLVDKYRPKKSSKIKGFREKIDKTAKKVDRQKKGEVL